MEDGGGPSRVAEGLAEERLAVSAQWVSRQYATRKPQPATFQQWTLSFEVECQAAEVLVARVLVAPGVLKFGRTHRSGAGTRHSLHLSFQWHDYGSSDLVSIGFTDGNDLTIEDREVGLRPQEWVEVAAPQHATTGFVIPLALLARVDGLHAQMICVVKSDTTNTHGRLALKPQFHDSLLDQYAFLSTGAVSGRRRR